MGGAMRAGKKTDGKSEFLPATALFRKGSPDLVFDGIGNVETVERPQQEEPGHVLAAGSGKICIDRFFPLRGGEERPDCLLPPGGGKVTRNHALYTIECAHSFVSVYG
jgi:hypothetical protein